MLKTCLLMTDSAHSYEELTAVACKEASLLVEQKLVQVCLYLVIGLKLEITSDGLQSRVQSLLNVGHA